MKFICEKAVLLRAIGSVSRAVSAKSTLPALEGVLLEAETALTVTGYNLETGVRVETPARIEKRGEAVINMRLLFEIVRKLPDQPVCLEVDDKLTATIRCGMSEFNVPATPAADFPEIPYVEKQKTITLPGQTLGEMIGRTVFAVSQNENKPVHTGSLFEVSEKGLTIVSVDGFRLALCTERLERPEGAENFSFVVPGNALKEVERMTAEGSDSPVELTLGPRHITFTQGDTVILSRLLDGEFINYNNAIPKDQPIRIKVNRAQLCDCLDRMSIVINEKLKNPVKCVLDDGVIKLSSRAAVGRAYDECPSEGTGGGLEIGFNNRFLLEALRATSDEEVIMEFGTGLSPCVISPVSQERYLFMVLPVRLRAGE